jgi:GNAT superfamily N-acetyltransferase
MADGGNWDLALNGLTLLTGIAGGILSYFLLSKPGKEREERLEKSAAYLQLELASIEVFKYKAACWYSIEWAMTGENPEKRALGQIREEADQYFYQCLNPFEIASRFRKEGVIVPEIYASWVAWFFETLEFPYFREQWTDAYRDNYTLEVREIFDAGVALGWRAGANPNVLREAFYASVADIIACDEIRHWRVPVPHAPETEARRSEVDVSGMAFLWDRGSCAAEAAAFAARVIGAQPSYISHGEIQCGLTTPDGAHWIEGLEQRYTQDFASPGDREMLIARDAAGAIVGIGILHPELDGLVRYGVVEDMAVDPTSRSGGIGHALLERLVERARESGCAWVFLESGLGNEQAHRFFEREGFTMTSHVFARRLD